MITEAGNIRTIYGIGCMGFGCGGLGQDSMDLPTSIDGSTYDPTTDTWYDPAVGASSAAATLNLASTYNPVGTGGALTTGGAITAAPSTSVGTSATQAVSAISNAFTSIFKAIQPLPQGCTQIQNVYGTSTQCNAAGTASTLNLSTASIGGLSLGTLLLLGGGLFLVMSMSKGH